MTVRGRHFRDLNDPWVVDDLSEKVIGLLERCGFGYLKVDSNETIGLGCDDPYSVGEGLRKRVHASYRFFELVRYSLAATFLGRMCLSGGIAKLPDESWQLTRDAIALYQKAAPEGMAVLKNGILQVKPGGDFRGQVFLLVSAA